MPQRRGGTQPDVAADGRRRPQLNSIVGCAGGGESCVGVIGDRGAREASSMSSAAARPTSAVRARHAHRHAGWRAQTRSASMMAKRACRLPGHEREDAARARRSVYRDLQYEPRSVGAVGVCDDRRRGPGKRARTCSRHGLTARARGTTGRATARPGWGRGSAPRRLGLGRSRGARGAGGMPCKRARPSLELRVDARADGLAAARATPRHIERRRPSKTRWAAQDQGGSRSDTADRTASAPSQLRRRPWAWRWPMRRWIGHGGGHAGAVGSDRAPTGAGRVRHGVEAAASARAPGGGK